MFQKLSKAEIGRYQATSSYPEYADFLSEIKPGEGGRVDVTQAGVSRQTVKNRLNKTAAALGVELKYMRSGQSEVLFEVVRE